LVAILSILMLFGCMIKPEPVEIRYAAWNLGPVEENGIERQMVQEFMKANPSIKVVIDEDFTKNYNDAMKRSAKTDTIPDVFMYAGNSDADDRGWCYDLSDQVEKDPEWTSIPKVLREAVQVKGKVVAIPMSMYLYGYFCNDTVLKNSEVAAVNYGISADEFAYDVRRSTDIANGRIGLGDSSSICEWYPASRNDRFGWFSWDGGKFNLNSQEFKEAVELTRNLNQNKYCFGQLSADDQKKLRGDNDWAAWSAGTVAFKFDGTWSVSNYSKLPFPIRFIGMPGGRACIVPDFLFVSQKSAHPKEAYEFAKFMSAYSKQGFAKRLDLADQNHFEVTTMPMVGDSALIDRFFKLVRMGGIREVYNRISNDSYLEETKLLPGYELARWNYKTNITIGEKPDASIGDVLQAACRGQLKWEDVASELNYLANTCIRIYPQQLNN